MAYIKAMAYSLPETRLTNEDLYPRFGEKAVKSITKMAGITERRVTAPGETALSLATQAALKLFEEHGCDPKSIDLLIFVSQTGDYQVPANACILHERLGLRENCACFDINQGCSAFPYGLSVANSMLETGVASRALLINADVVTQLLYPKDRALVTLHGDAAVATLLDCSAPGGKLCGFHLGTDGTGWRHIQIPCCGADRQRNGVAGEEIVTEAGSVATNKHLQMDGPAVFHFSLYKVPEAIQQALTKWHWTVDDCALVLLHQANKTMVEIIYRALNVPAEKQFYFMEKVGNVAGASSPLLLSQALRQGKIKSGDKLLLAAFGNGLSWGAVAIEWT